MPVCVIWWQGELRLDSRKGGTGHEFSEELDCSTFMDSWGSAPSLKFRQRVVDGYLVLCVKRVVLHLNVDIIADLLHFRWHVIIISLQTMDETVDMIVVGRRVLFVHRYQNFKVELGITSVGYRRCWGVEITAALMALSSLFTKTVLVTAAIWFIWRRKGTIRLRNRLFIVNCIFRGTQGSYRVLLLERKFVLFLCILAHDFHVWHALVMFHSGLLKKVFLNMVFTNLTTGTVREVALIVPVVTWLTCTALFRKVWEAEHWTVFENDRLTTVWITDFTLLSGLDSVARSASPSSHTSASSAGPGY